MRDRRVLDNWRPGDRKSSNRAWNMCPVPPVVSVRANSIGKVRASQRNSRITAPFEPLLTKQ
jgi:hypothetical protein